MKYKDLTGYILVPHGWQGHKCCRCELPLIPGNGSCASDWGESLRCYPECPEYERPQETKMEEQTQPKSIDMACKREKYWEERDHAEKISALRETVTWMSRELADAVKVIRMLTQHQHAADGALVAPLVARLVGDGPEGYTPDYARLCKTERERQR